MKVVINSRFLASYIQILITVHSELANETQCQKLKLKSTWEVIHRLDYSQNVIDLHDTYRAIKYTVIKIHGN